MTLRAALLAIATTLVILGGPKNARGDVESDNAAHWLVPSWRVSSAVHRSSLPAELTLCHPQGKTCPLQRTLAPGEFQGGAVWTNAIELGTEMFAFGPFRFGIEGSFGWGTGPTGRVAPAPSPRDGSSVVGTTQTISSQWERSAGSLVFGLRVRGPGWRAFVEVLPGFTGLFASVSGAASDDASVVANGNGWTVGTRAGVGLIANRYFTASLFGSAGFGLIRDESAGVRLELHTSALFEGRK